ncbi:MAG: ATP-binding protein [Deltaproteobacteria bacterium]|nr:ATP-binding protein [Deltaproteobacteria bacterium]MBW1952168.1 ATP-binding protein [Deltaproteobacteria bacterium]MBW1985702.1 ATP-binding protein [Deltaproteobacteria bacterium]MBW2134616.1 ATP-binding protein [Deltaproteobacteria bacterium]
MKIAIASGKGGTGKTTLAVNLAAALGNQAQLLDCDVEEPNAHLFLPLFQAENETVTAPVPQVDLDRCNFCGACGQICQFSAIVPLEQTVLIFPEMCHSCRGCFLVCEAEAIHERTRQLGEIQSGVCQEGVHCVYGRLRVGEAMAPPLIREVKGRMDLSRTVIIDAPPGTSCPVIAALKDADYVILVTEPTPFGFHDLKLAVETVRTMGLPMGVIINRSDVGTPEVQDYCDREDIPVLLSLPYSRQIAEAYSRGQLLTAAIPGFKEQMVGLMEQITKGWQGS